MGGFVENNQEVIPLDALTYLKQVNNELNEITRLRDEVSFIDDSLTLQGIDMTRERVQYSRRQYAGYEDSVAQIMEIRGRILSRIAGLLEKHETVIIQLSELPESSHSDILFFRYLLGLTWERIAEKTNYSIRAVFKIHPKALQAFEEVHHDFLSKL